jgi:tetratricopeptide (TPR) repeat protein
MKLSAKVRQYPFYIYKKIVILSTWVPLLLQQTSYMKQLTYLLLLLMLACNNDEGSQQKDDAPSKEKQLMDAVRQFPDSALLVENLAQYYRENSHYEKAIQSINIALQKDSLNARFWDIKATLHFEDGDTLAAIKAFERSIDLSPQPDVIISLGVLYAQTKNQMALAIADGLMLGKKAAAEKEAFFIKGLYFSNMNDKKLAISYFDKCLNLNYSFMEAYREKAIALYDLGNYNEALKVLDRAVTLQNNFDEGYYFMGRNLEKLNKPTEAIEMYQQALLYDPEYIEAKDALARLGVKN